MVYLSEMLENYDKLIKRLFQIIRFILAWYPNKAIKDVVGTFSQRAEE